MKKYLSIITVALLLVIGTAGSSFAEGSLFDGFKTDIVYLYSFNSAKSAGAVRASVPVFELSQKTIGHKITFNIDGLGVLADQGDTALKVGLSASVEGLSAGIVSLGVTYIPSNDYRFTGYVAITPIRF